MNVWFLAAKANGLRVRDEMNFVAALRQFQSQLRGYNSAAAVGGVARDPDLHSARPPFLVLYRLCSSMAENKRGCRFYRDERYSARKKDTRRIARRFLRRDSSGRGPVCRAAPEIVFSYRREDR